MIITNIKIYKEDQTSEAGCIFIEGGMVTEIAWGDIQVADVALEKDPDIVDGSECIVIAGKIGADTKTGNTSQFGAVKEHTIANLIMISEDSEVMAVIENGEFIDLE